MKMVNLFRDWLRALLPHVLAKVDRVHYGLLTPADLQRAFAANPHLPASRRLFPRASASVNEWGWRSII